MKNKKMELILFYARTQRNHSQNAVSGSLVQPNVKKNGMLNKATAQVAALNKDLQKGIEGKFLALYKGI